MRAFATAAAVFGIVVTGLSLPAQAAEQGATAAQAPSDVIRTCGDGYAGYIRRFGKDALCLKPGTRTWGGFEAFECGGKVTVYFKDGSKIGCPTNFPSHGGVVKTVAYR
ncbi:hypothetical protein [Amycolatopsis albispora]|uniref:Uncharacterized protein n=1 Tax=Amycolatopsis albispora TaxID=1804986 RepID=A0A344LAN3_9PSEU|nr:hypothetical protein [Amycolatopsis albispora]AXB45107.1 hypothetical protein A4R43_23565 [Amycolatopsis albispora]